MIFSGWGGYFSISFKGSKTNIATDVTRAEFENNLQLNGWNYEAYRNNGALYTQNGAKYFIRDLAKTYPGSIADFTPAGFKDAILKIRLDYWK